MIMVNGQLMAKPPNGNQMPSVSVSAPNAFTMVVPPAQTPQGPMSPAGLMSGAPPTSGPTMPAFQPIPGNGSMSGTPMGMANSFTIGGNTRPIPADFGTDPQMENAMTYMGQNAFANGGVPGAAARPPLPPSPPGWFPGAMMVTQQQVAMADDPQTGYLIGLLRSDPLPSEREMAVEQ
jgi:hypothetical protein